MSQHAYTKIHRRNSIKHLSPREASVEDLADRLILLLFKYSICDSCFVSATTRETSAMCSIFLERAHRTSYFGSHCTYPLLKPFTSLITISKLLKSNIATVSKATSRITRDHSKKE